MKEKLEIYLVKKKNQFVKHILILVFTYGGLFLGIWQMFQILKQEFEISVSNENMKIYLKDIISKIHPINNVNIVLDKKFEEGYAEIAKLSHTNISVNECKVLLENIYNPIFKNVYQTKEYDNEIIENILLEFMKIQLYKKEIPEEKPVKTEEKPIPTPTENEEPKEENLETNEENKEVTEEKKEPEESEEDRMKREEDERIKQENEAKLEKEMNDLRSKISLTFQPQPNFSTLSCIIRQRLPILPPEPIIEEPKEEEILKEADENIVPDNKEETKVEQPEQEKVIETQEGKVKDDENKVETHVEEEKKIEGNEEIPLQEEVLEEVPKEIEESFIEPYNGSSYDTENYNPLRFSDEQVNEILEDIFVYGVSGAGQYQIALFDPISQASLVKFLYQVYVDYVKSAEEKEVKSEDLVRQVLANCKILESHYMESFQNKELPIFDILKEFPVEQ